MKFNVKCEIYYAKDGIPPGCALSFVEIDSFRYYTLVTPFPFHENATEGSPELC